MWYKVMRYAITQDYKNYVMIISLIMFVIIIVLFIQSLSSIKKHYYTAAPAFNIQVLLSSTCIHVVHLHVVLIVSLIM